MAKFLPSVDKKQSFGSLIGKSLGEGLSKGLVTGLESIESQNKAIAKQLQSNLGRARSATKSVLSLRDPNKSFDVDMIQELEQITKKNIQAGYNPDDASSLAFEEISNRYPDVPDKEPGKLSKNLSKIKSEILDYPEKAINLAAQGGRKLVGAVQGISDLLTPSKHPIAGMESPQQDENYPQGMKALELYDQLVGERGIPKNDLENIASSVVFGPSGLIGEAAATGLEHLGLPEWASNLGNIGTMILSQNRFSKFGSLKTAEKALKKASGISKRTGVPVDDILKSTGVDLEAVAAGDEAATSQLSRRISEMPEVGVRVKEAPKSVYDKNAAIREREVFGQRLSESPLEDYFEIRDREALRQERKRPETLAKEQEIREALRPEEQRIFNEMRNQKENIAEMKKQRRQSPADQHMVRDFAIDAEEAKLDKIYESLKDVQYQMKYGRPRPTEAEIAAQVEKKIQSFAEEIRNPSPEGKAKAEKAIEDDRKLLEKAQKILNRGELPGELRPDTYIKMQEAYLKGYETSLKEQARTIQELSQKPKMTASDMAKFNEAKAMENLLKDRIQALESKIVIQADNIKAMKALGNKGSGAFYKQQLKNTRRELERFNHTLFKQNRIKSPQEIKTQKAFKEQSKNIENGKRFAENPTKESAKEIAEQAGISTEEAFKKLNEMKKETKPIGEQVKKGTITPNTAPKWLKSLKKFSIGWGIGNAIGAVISLFEQATGTKIKPQNAKNIWTALSGVSAGSATLGYNFVNDMFEDAQAEHLRSLRSRPTEWNKYVKNVENKFSKAKAKRIVKKANESS